MKIIDNPEDSDTELPADNTRMIAKIRSNDYLRLYQMKNPMHDPDREKAKSIEANLVMPSNMKKVMNNVYLNRIKEEDLDIELNTEELFNIG